MIGKEEMSRELAEEPVKVPAGAEAAAGEEELDIERETERRSD